MTAAPHRGPGRRALLSAGFVGILGAGLLSACREAAAPAAAPTQPPSQPTADDLALARARSEAARLAAVAADLAASRPDLAALLGTVVADHRAHLVALGAPQTPATGGSAAPRSPSPGSPAPRASTSAPGPRAARARVQAVIDGEVAGAQDALTDVLLVTPGLAALLARVAASRATHGDLLAAKAGLRPPGVLAAPPPTGSATAPALTPSGATVSGATAITSPGQPSPAGLSMSHAGSSTSHAGSVAGPVPTLAVPTAVAPTSSSPTRAAAPAPAPVSSPSGGTQPTAPTGSPAARLPPAGADALAALTSGEHAAVYAYGVVVARVAERDRARARQAWAWHLARRDVLEERLLAAGLRPPAAAPAYELGPLPAPGAVVTLAATVEDRIAALVVRAVATTTGADRADAAAALVAVARRAAAWRGRGASLPG